MSEPKEGLLPPTEKNIMNFLHTVGREKKPEPTEPKEGIKKEFKRQFNDFPTSALWYIPVWNFIEKAISDVGKASREEALKEVENMICENALPAHRNLLMNKLESLRKTN